MKAAIKHLLAVVLVQVDGSELDHGDATTHSLVREVRSNRG
jgi:hypothetical protein